MKQEIEPVGRDNFSSFTANLPNREVADLEDRFLGVALWIVHLRLVFVSRKKHLHSSEDITSNVQPTDPSSCSSSSSSAPPKWDVFLSFYGKDTRRGFTSHLYSALDQQGILTFRDDPALDKGQEISSALLEAIKQSKIFIVVLSENYARSPWCLNELVQILKCKTTQIQVIPVFYYVDPSDVRHQKGSFREALNGHRKRHSVDMIEKWTSALSEIAALSGHRLRKEANEKESEIIQKIVGDVASRASTTVLHQEKNLFGIDSAVEEIYQLLSMESDAVRAIGICGMGGIGKTTIAKAFYNRYCNKFDISCFSVNVKQHSQGGSSLLQLLQQLLIDLLRKKDYKIPDVESGIRKLTHILHSKRALIVLDDLDCANYSELLASIGNLFPAGSKIIITTRDANLLNKLKADISEVDTYMVKTLGEIESLELFSYHAFRKSVPPESFKELSLNFVTHAGGLPLALKVLGSSLLGRTDESFWKEKLEKVKAIPENDIQKILQLSYDELEDETQKKIFLDIAFFVGKDKDEATDVFKSCDFFPGVGIQNLVDRCLVTIDEDNTLQMHNLIQDMGRELGKTTRLFLRGNAWKSLQNPEGKNNVEGLILDLTTSTNKQMSTVIFQRMHNLRLLQIIDANDITGSFENLLPKLRCIRWHYCPWKYLSSTFCPEDLVSFDMSGGKFKRLWKGPKPIKQMNYLTCLNLSKCSDLKRLPDSLGDMKALKKIDASWTAIEKLPDSITKLKGLITLKFYKCKKLRKLPQDIGNMQGLEYFDARLTAIEQLPDSFGGLVNLVELDLAYCKKLRNLPNSICKLKLLKGLYLSCCSNLEQLPEQLGKMQSLEYLSAANTAIEQLPDSIELLGKLKRLYFTDCKKLKFVPASIWNLTSVEDLSLHPGETDEISLPDSVKDMNKLWNLNLTCNVRLCLPMILCFPSLQMLTLTDDGPVLSSAIPFSLSKLFNLRSLTLNNCTSLGSSLPELPLNLRNLNIYNHTSLEQLPDLSSLGKCVHLNIKGCINLQSISLLPSHLILLIIEKCTSLRDVPDLSMLKELERLSFRGCNNLKSRSLEQSFLEVKRPFKADLPNTEVAEWFNYKSSGHTVSFLVPPNFSGLALWVVYTCKPSKQKQKWANLRAVIRNDTDGITEKYLFDVQPVVGELHGILVRGRIYLLHFVHLNLSPSICLQANSRFCGRGQRPSNR
ncbi:TMV resistance protein N-like isoform X5 [Apium graveolens]|uniref:TMV resistance protein N-like isoform X5 n=1 Tax=Apium graveolens TaxID=4045 RepID=UPI003D7AC59D